MFGLTGRALTQRLSAAVGRFRRGNLQEWAGVALCFVTLAIPVWSIEHGRWINPQPSFILVLGLAVLASLLLVKSRISDRTTLALMIILGLAVAFWQSSSLYASTEAEPALKSWWHAVSGFQLSEETVYFTIFLIIVTWVIGSVSTWFILRKRNVWVAIALGTIMILVNLSNLPRSDHYFFPIYLFAAVLLIGMVNLLKQGDWFRKLETYYSQKGVTYLMTAVLCISILAVGTAWFVPETPVNQLALSIGSGTATGSEAAWFNIFAGVSSKWSVVRSSDQETLFFRDGVAGGSRIQFVISSDRSGYWRTRRYDTYHSWGWTSSVTSDRALDPGVLASEGRAISRSDVLKYTVENRLKTDVVLTGGELIFTDIPVLLQTLSADQSVVEGSITASNRQTTTGTDNIEGEAGDVVAVVSPRMFGPYQRYTVTVAITSVTGEELSQAGDDYPSWITDYYLQLPDSLPERVGLLSRELSLGVETPYDKVIAIKKFVNTFEYDQESEVPPEEVDGVDCFLFSDKKGACINFASAMVVMLRSVGVPARLCTGYLRGELDEDTQNYVIRNQNYHAWAEVYFPGYGWIGFEATPGSESENEEGIIGVGSTFSDTDQLPEWMEIETPGPPGLLPSSSGTHTTPSGPKLYVYFIIAGVLVALVFAARLAIDRWVRRLKRVGSAFEAYDRMCFLASLGKSGPIAQETPLEFSARLALAVPAQAETIDHVTQAYMDIRYSPRKELTLFEKSRLQNSWVVLCPFLLKRLLRLRRSSG